MNKFLFNILRFFDYTIILFPLLLMLLALHFSIISDTEDLNNLQETKAEVVKLSENVYMGPLVTFTLDDLTYTTKVSYPISNAQIGEKINITYVGSNPNVVTNKSELLKSIKAANILSYITLGITLFTMYKVSRYKYKHYKFNLDTKYPKDIE